MKFPSLIICMLCFNIVNAQSYIEIPDSNFKAYLLSDIYINTTPDNEIDSSEAINFTGEINCSDLGIHNLKGIEAFENLTSLKCNLNSLRFIQLGNKTKLTELDISDNQISGNLNLSSCPNLEFLYCNHNTISSLNLENCINLSRLECNFNDLQYLDLSNNIELFKLACSTNQLQFIELGNKPKLYKMDFSGNEIENINISQCSNLRELSSGYNLGLSGIDISNNKGLTFWNSSHCNVDSVDISSNPNLQILFLFNNPLMSINFGDDCYLYTLSVGNTKIEDLDFHKISRIEKLGVYNTKLKEIDLSQNLMLNDFDAGLNANLQKVTIANNISEYFNLSYNPSLYCIEVSDVDYYHTNWSKQIDEQASFNLECNISVDELKNEANIVIYPNPCSNLLNLALNADQYPTKVSIYDCLGNNIESQQVTNGQLNTSHLPMGVYFLKYIYKGQTSNAIPFIKGN